MTDRIPASLSSYIDALRDHDADRVANTVADDMLFISATRFLDKPQFLAMLRALYAAFPDWKYEHDGVEVRGEGNYAIKWRQSGTHTGTWKMPGMKPIAPTGKRVQIVPHYFFYRVNNGLLVLIFPEPVRGGAPRGILEQIGIDLPPL